MRPRNRIAAKLAILLLFCFAASGSGATESIDLSFLNSAERPAGRHGFLHVARDRLVFSDGTAARFWGTNLTAYAVTGTSREAVRREAHRLSSLGFNMVRIDHLDADWLKPNIFGASTAKDTQHLYEPVLSKLDWWIKCLEDEGIYVWLDLQQDRRFRAGDGISAFAEISKGRRDAGLRGYAYVNPSIQLAMERFNEAFINHRNQYTGKRYKDDPGIVAMLLTNENDITHHFGNALLPDKRVPWHSARYIREATSFAQKWGLSKGHTWRSWEPGPAKLFLNDLEHRFNVEMIAALRSQGVKIPIVTTSQWGDNPLSSLPALTAGDLIDVHAYGGVGELRKNPLIEPNMVDWLAAAQVAGKPLSVSEWNVEPFPVPDRGTIPLYVAAAARLQGWRAVMQFAYSQLPLGQAGKPGNWEAHDDPALLATLPAAALMYRRGDVKESRTVYLLSPSAHQLFYQLLSPKTSVALRTATERGRVLVVLPKSRELAWLHDEPRLPAGRVISDLGEPQLAPDVGSAVSDTGELRRDWRHGTFSIDTPRTQAAMGAIGGRKIELTDAAIALTTRNATVCVQSLDNKPIRDSKHILISLEAGATPEPRNQLPFRVETVRGRVSIRAVSGLRLFVLAASARTIGRIRPGGDSVGSAREGVSVSYRNNRYIIDLLHGAAVPWLVLQ